MAEQKIPTLYDYLNQFKRVYETGILTDKAVVLYWNFISMFNAYGWKEWVGVDTAQLMAMLHITNKQTAFRERDVLVKAGLLEYKKGNRGKISEYRLGYNPVTYPVTYPVTPHKIEDIRTKTNNTPPYPPEGGTGSVPDAPANPAEPPQNPEPSKPKRGTRRKDPPFSPELTPDEETAILNVSPALCGAVTRWFRYKSEERKQPYKPIGREQFVKMVLQSARQYGVDPVIDVIESSIANGYQGVTWDKLKRGGGPNAGKRTMADIDRVFEELREEMGQS